MKLIEDTRLSSKSIEKSTDHSVPFQHVTVVMFGSLIIFVPRFRGTVK